MQQVEYLTRAAEPFVLFAIFHVVLILILLSIRWALMIKFSISSLASMLYAIMLGIVAYSISAFEIVFESFGANLPAVTKLVFDYKYVLWMPLALIVTSWWPLRAKAWRGKFYFICFLCEAALLSIVIVAMYLPIFPFGQVI